MKYFVVDAILIYFVVDAILILLWMLF